MIKGSRTYQSSVLPGQRNVYGPFGDVGYILKNPDCAAMASERTQRRRYELRELARKKTQDAKTLERDAFVKRFHERLDVVKIRSAVRRVVDLGVKEVENELERKRNKLRKTLLEDDSKYIAEYTDKAQTSLERRIQLTLKRVEEIENKNKISDYQFSQKAYERLAMENDEEFREELRLKSSKNLAEAIKAQLCEREYAKIQDENDDRIWSEMYEQRILAEKQEIENAERVKMQKRKEWTEILDRQIEAEERLKNNLKYLDELDEIRMKEYADRREVDYEVRDRILKDWWVVQAQILDQQMAENKRISERNKQEEVDVERIQIEDVQRKIRRAEAAKIDNRNETRAELSYFREATVQYRNAEAEEETIIDHSIENDRKSMDRKYILERKGREIEQRNFAHLCAQQSNQMVVEKAAREAYEEEMDAKCYQLYGYRNEFNKQLDRQRRLYNTVPENPGTVELQNEHNEKYLEVLRQRQILEDQEMLEKMRNSQNEMRNKIREAMAKPLPEIVGTSLHPFYARIKAKNS